jgi:hypothetical protein
MKSHSLTYAERTSLSKGNMAARLIIMMLPEVAACRIPVEPEDALVKCVLLWCKLWTTPQQSHNS